MHMRLLELTKFPFAWAPVLVVVGSQWAPFCSDQLLRSSSRRTIFQLSHDGFIRVKNVCLKAHLKTQDSYTVDVQWSDPTEVIVINLFPIMGRGQSFYGRSEMWKFGRHTQMQK